MSCTGKSLSLPSISCLDFTLLWDISGATPTVTVTNNSTVSNYAGLRWWFYITSPSGVAIYGVDLNTTAYPNPDVNGIAWTSKTFNLPTPFGNPPCGQIEFSPNSPYAVTVFVEDLGVSPAVLESYSKNTTVVRPNGNDKNSCGNFGVASADAKTDCLNKVIMCFDSTNLTYNNITTPSVITNKWVLVYPQDPSQNIPTREANSVPNVNFPISINSDAYTLYFNEFATYDLGNGISIKVQYKLFDKNGNPGLVFSINCNTNLCQLWCQMRKYYELSKDKCGTLENAEITNKMIRLNWLYSEILTGIFQPFCGIDVSALIEEWQKLAGATDGCGCGCGEGQNNFGFSNPTTGIPGSGGGCCPVTSNVIDKNTGSAPSACPGSFFPAQILDPTGTTVIGDAQSASDMIAIINANAAWQAYGIAFLQGNCQIGWFPANPATVPPVTKVIIDATGGLVKKGTTIPPTGCPTGNPYPLKIYDVTGTTVIGIANGISDVVSILNSNAGWSAYGTASAADSCHVKWQLINPTNIPPNIQTDPGNTTGNIVQVGTTLPPTGCPTGNPYPLRVYDPTGTTVIGIAYSINDVVSLVNANAAWAAYGTAVVKDNCSVFWTLINPGSVPPPIGTDTNTGGSGGCTNGTNIVTISITDVCVSNGPISSSDFPMNLWVDWILGFGLEYLGVATSQADIIAKLNAASNKPASVTFSAGTSGVVSNIQMVNTNCTAYNHVPMVNGDHGSNAFLLLGASHSNFVPLATSSATTGGEYAESLRNLGVLGKIPPGLPADGRPWHTILLGTTLITADAKNGKVWYYDMTNPLNPVFIRTITLNDVSGNCFTGLPHSKGIGDIPDTPSLFSLYFPTNPRGMTVNAHFVVESISGSIWKLNMADPTGVIDSLYDQRIKGKCPRVICTRLSDEPNIYFTQDGSLEQDAGISSGVGIGSTIRIDISGALDSTKVHVLTNIIDTGEENVYAADTDGIDTIYFVGEAGTITKYNHIADSIGPRYYNVFGPFNFVQLRGFALFYNNFLYVTSLNSFNAGTAQGTLRFDLSSLNSSPFAPIYNLFVSGVTLANHIPAARPYSITPLGNCLMMVPGDGFGSAIPGKANGGGVVIFKTDGSLVGYIQLPADVNIFNVVPFGNIPVYTPNSFV